MKKKKALGRGLESLLPSAPDIEPVTGVPADISVNSIDPNPFQPRIDWDDNELSSLAESIRQQGVLQPLVLRKKEKRYQLIAGERRLRASIIAGLETVPAYVRKADDRQMMALALIENIQRQDLNPMEKAEAFSRFCNEFNMTQEELGKQVGISRSAVANFQRLMELPEAVKTMIRSGKLSMGHGRALLGLPDEESILRQAKICLARGYSVRVLEDVVRKASGKKPAKKKAVVIPEIKRLETELQRIMGTRVFLKDTGGKGKLEIEYSSLDELDRILSILRSRGNPV
ncbi:MAG: ParB/RepB/Spo0J family partition protein [Candidatus Fermentibacteraceae bacterium]|nr:ParB/RepB/Spo0J family partition protein [Candidatus Fermentibacteraceae bacterium]